LIRDVIYLLIDSLTRKAIMDLERIDAFTAVTVLAADRGHNRPVPRSASRSAHGQAIFAPTYYALKHGAVTQTAPLTRAKASILRATTRTLHAIDIDLHD
jgi:hypothetical protein